MSGTHAILSPSASHRWLNCTTAPSLEIKMPDDTSVFAEEGTLAHAICECKLHELNGDGKAEELYIKEHGRAWENEELYSSEMEETSDYYRDIVAEKLAAMCKRSPDAVLLIEVKLDFSTWIPEGFGTADAVIVGEGEIDIIDYKHGRGVAVSANKNPQMMTYALGACESFELEYSFDKVTMTIVQPRIDNTNSWQLPYDALKAWGNDVLIPKAREAFNGTLGCNTTTKAGEWCKFCKARATCRERAEFAKGLLEYGNPKTLSPKEIGKLLPIAAFVKEWCSDLETHALALMLDGTPVEGYKVVMGRSLRKVTNSEQLARNMLDAGISADMIYKPRELKAIGELEKLVGKNAFSELSEGCIEKPAGKPTIATENDPRKAYSSIEDDFSHIIDNK